MKNDMSVENNTRTPLDYEQHLLKGFKELYFDGDEFKLLRERIVKESTIYDGVVFAVRKNEIHIYYLGGRLLKITKSNGRRLRFYIDEKYTKISQDSEERNEFYPLIKDLNDHHPTDEKAWLADETWEKLKECIKRYRSDGGCSPNPERQLQHRIELDNRSFNGEVVIVDNEYGVRKLRLRTTNLHRETLHKLTAVEKQRLLEYKKDYTEEKIYSLTDGELDDLRRECKLCMVDLVAIYKTC